MPPRPLPDPVRIDPRPHREHRRRVRRSRPAPTGGLRVARILKRSVLLATVAIPVALVTVLALVLSPQPMIVRTVALTPADVDRAYNLLKQYDPRHAPDGEVRTVEVAGPDVDLMAAYLAGRVGGDAEVSIRDREVVVLASVQVPGIPIPAYVNVSTVFGETTGLPRIERMLIGRLAVPHWLANRALDYAEARAVGAGGAAELEEIVDTVAFGEGLVRVEYVWNRDLPDRLRAMALPSEDAERLRAYHERLVRTVEGLPFRQASLVDLIGPVIALAAERSEEGEPGPENRAAIVALALYVTGRGPGALVPGGRDWRRVPPRQILLRGRDDLPKHFLISASLAATAGTPLSDAIGVFKEIDDSRDGSGFSFSDIVADRAGTRFGELAMAEASARGLQEAMADELVEDDLIPQVADLADHMMKPEFERRFGGVGAPAYQAVVDEIEARVAACRLFL